MIPFFKNSSSIPFAASSRASRPSFRPTFDSSIIFLIVSPGSVAFSLNGNANDLNPAIKPLSLFELSSELSEPPIVIIIDGISIKFPSNEKPPSPVTIPNITIASPIITPKRDAISTYVHLPLYFYS